MAPVKKSSQFQSKLYVVLNDGILGATQPDQGEAAPHQFHVLKGQVTGADLIAAQVDVEWQLKIGNLEELGYVPS